MENRSVTDWLTFEGQTKTLSEWARIKKLPRLALHARIYTLKWSVEEALTKPLRIFKKTELRRNEHV